MWMLIETTTSALIHAIILVITQTNLLNLNWIERGVASFLAIIKIVGYTIWIREDSYQTRRVYVYSQLFAYLGLVSASIYKFLHLCLEYLEDALSDQRSELVVLSSFIALYGVVELFLTMGFTDYNYVQNQLDQYKEP